MKTSKYWLMVAKKEQKGSAVSVSAQPSFHGATMPGGPKAAFPRLKCKPLGPTEGHPQVPNDPAEGRVQHCAGLSEVLLDWEVPVGRREVITKSQTRYSQTQLVSSLPLIGTTEGAHSYLFYSLVSG